MISTGVCCMIYLLAFVTPRARQRTRSFRRSRSDTVYFKRTLTRKRHASALVVVRGPCGLEYGQVLKSYLDDRGLPRRSTFFDIMSIKEK